MSLENPSKFLENIINNPKEINIKDQELKKNLSIVSRKIESQKAVYNILIVLLVKKLIDPDQDIRYHQKELPNGFSGRTFDQKYITPTMKKHNLPAMAESAWLTRSLEQPHAFDKNFPGKIKDRNVKKSFLEIIDNFQKNPSNCETILNYLINEGKKIRTQSFEQIKKIKSADKLHINELVKLIDLFINQDFKISGGSKLPVIFVYTIYQIMTNEITRYKGLKLKKLGFHTTSDRTSKSSGDIELFKGKSLFEVLEIKHNVNINEHIVRNVYSKIKKFNPQRYFIIHTLSLSRENLINLNKKIEEIKKEHGCQIIIDNFFACLSSYLRLINSVEGYINLLSKNIIEDKELKLVHKKKWKELIESKFN